MHHQALLLLALVAGAVALINPLVECSACEAVAREFTARIEKGKDDKSTIIKSHRLGKDNKKQKINYQTSELHALELLEELCDGMSRYNLRQKKNSYERIFTTDYTETKVLDHYDNDEKDTFKDMDKQLKWKCSQWVDEQQDTFVAAVKEQLNAPTFGDRLCNATLGLCLETYLQPFRVRETEKRSVWLKERKRKKKIADAKKKKKEEEEAAKKKAEDEEKAKREAEEAAKNPPPADQPADQGSEQPPPSDSTQPDTPTQSDTPTETPQADL